jgi:endonuclease YncB( thermonuclease family)
MSVPNTATPYDLFISYADADRAWVEDYLAVVLRQADLRWRAAPLADLDSAADALPLAACRRVLLIISPAYMAHGFPAMIRRLEQCYGRDQPIWPVSPLILHPVPFPPQAAFLPVLDARNPESWPGLVRRLCAELGQPVRPLAAPGCPYPGLRPFAAEEARFFYGREREVDLLLARLCRERFVLLAGPSGAGKTSLGQAGLLPELAAHPYWPPRFWLPRSVRPGPGPQAALDALHSPGVPASVPERLTALLAGTPGAGRLLLVIDPLEDVFTLATPGEQAAFFATVQALRADAGCALLLVLRSDFYPQLMDTVLWPIPQRQRLALAPLIDGALRRAIGQPAADRGVGFEPGLLERLAAEAAVAPAPLPALQETLVRLWATMDSPVLTLGAYESWAGRADSGLGRALVLHADATIQALPLAQQTLARQILCALVQPRPDRPGTARPQSIACLRAAAPDPEWFNETLHHLAIRRLVALQITAGIPTTVTLAHEALIAGWPTLDTWLRESSAPAGLLPASSDFAALALAGPQTPVLVPNLRSAAEPLQLASPVANLVDVGAFAELATPVTDLATSLAAVEDSPELAPPVADLATLAGSLEPAMLATDVATVEEPGELPRPVVELPAVTDSPELAILGADLAIVEESLEPVIPVKDLPAAEPVEAVMPMTDRSSAAGSQEPLPTAEPAGVSAPPADPEREKHLAVARAAARTRLAWLAEQQAEAEREQVRRQARAVLYRRRTRQTVVLGAILVAVAVAIGAPGLWLVSAGPAPVAAPTLATTPTARVPNASTATVPPTPHLAADPPRTFPATASGAQPVSVLTPSVGASPSAPAPTPPPGSPQPAAAGAGGAARAPLVDAGAARFPQTSATPPPADSPDLTLVIVSSVVAPDLLDVISDGTPVRVRLLGIVAPDTPPAGPAGVCIAPQALAAARQLIVAGGRQVWLEKDPAEAATSGPLLRYVWVPLLTGRALLEEALVAQGHAQVRLRPSDLRYRDRLLAAERQAQVQRLGLWGACDRPTGTASPAGR